MRYVGGFASDRGNYRENNEDNGFFKIAKGDTQLAFGLVCDGIGGLDGGEIASGFIAEAADEWFRSVSDWFDVQACDTELAYSHLRDGVEDWNGRFYHYMKDNGLHSGTTMSAVLLVGDRRCIVHVGDSRIYRYTPSGGLALLTDDQIVTRLQNGILRTLLANYMGKNEQLHYTATIESAEEDELILYGSDGFYHYLTEEDAAAIYVRACDMASRGEDIAELCRFWIGEMASRGEKDNISVGLIYSISDRIKMKKQKRSRAYDNSTRL